MNKRISHLLAVLVVAALLLPAQVMAKGAQGVEYTVHNLSSGSAYGFYNSTNEDEVCIFCHTPHGGSLAGPLWNKALPDGTAFTHYSSSTLESAASVAGRVVQNESLLCLSCHDGALAVNRVLNAANDTGAQPTTIMGDMPIMGAPGLPGPWIGTSSTSPLSTTDLSDDHPISFSYSSAYNDETSSGANGLYDPPTALSKGIRLFGVDQRVECSSCHDPHVDYDPTLGGGAAGTAYRPFLITPNTGSALCLACHIK